jgi:L-ascorbate metabolism protein UlaG (beta-lactamase superfamily)
MKRLLMLLPCFAGLAAAQPAPASVTLTWLGQSTFVMNTSTGLKALLDPTNPGAFKPAPVDGLDLVTITHEHPDHNYVKLATGNPEIIRGLADGEVAKIDRTVKGVRIRTVAAFHDTQQGAQRGKNAIFVFEMPGIRLAHLGDLGHTLDAQQVSAIGPVDVVLIPVGGGPTIDPKTALEVAGQLKAKVIVPMHVGVAPAAAGAPFRLGTMDDFLKVLDPAINVVQAGHTMTLTAGKLPADRTVMVMKYE